MRNIVQRHLRTYGESATEEGRGQGYTFIMTKLTCNIKQFTASSKLFTCIYFSLPHK